MAEIVDLQGRGKRLKSLDEFRRPAWGGARILRWRRRGAATAWLLAGAITLGACGGWHLGG